MSLRYSMSTSPSSTPVMVYSIQTIGTNGRDWHIWVHTHEHCETRSGRSGHRTLHTSLDTSGLTRTRGPGPTIGALSDTAGHREPEKANRGRWMVEPMSRPDCGWLWPGSGEGCHWCGPGWAHWGSVLTPHQAVAVRVTEDKHQWGETHTDLTRPWHWPTPGAGAETPPLLSQWLLNKKQMYSSDLKLRLAGLWIGLLWWLEIQISPILSLNWHKYSNNTQLIHV